MPTFNFSFTVNASLRAVLEFHQDTAALKKLTPPPVIVQIQNVEPLGEGSISKFTLWVGPLPLRWIAKHSQVSYSGFTDTQAIGPAKSWVHKHTFTPISKSKTQIDEHITFEHRPGYWGIVTRLLFAKPNLYFMFTYRKYVTRWQLRNAKYPIHADLSL